MKRAPVVSQNPSTSAAIRRAISIFDGAFSSRDIVGCEHKGSPLSGAWPTAILKIGSCRSESQSSGPRSPVGQLSSDAGVLVLRGVEKKLGLAARLAACIRDRRKPERIEHPA